MFTDNKTAALKREDVENIKTAAIAFNNCEVGAIYLDGAGPFFLDRAEAQQGRVSLRPPVSRGNRGSDHLAVYLWSVLCCMTLFFPLCIALLLYHYCTILAGRFKSLYGVS